MKEKEDIHPFHGGVACCHINSLPATITTWQQCWHYSGQANNFCNMQYCSIKFTLQYYA
jgi:hypothetical protein